MARVSASAISVGHVFFLIEYQSVLFRERGRYLQEKSALILPFQADPVPLRADGGGGFRVGDSRVLLDVVLDEYENGADAESITVEIIPASRTKRDGFG